MSKINVSVDVRKSCRKFRCLSMSDIQASVDVGNSGVCRCQIFRCLSMSDIQVSVDVRSSGIC